TTVTLTPIDDLEAEDLETVTLSVQGNAAYVIGGAGTDSLTITDNEDIVETIDSSTPVIFVDGDGDRVTVTLRGAGSGQITRQGGAIDQILLTGTTDRSSLKIAASGTGTSVGNITINGSLNALSARNSDLTGDLTATGFVKRIQLRDVVGDSRIEIGPGLQNTDAVTLALGRVTDLSIDSQAAIRSLSAVDWQDTDGSSIDTIEAPSIASLRITGHRRSGVDGVFEASMNLTGNTGTQATLGRAVVAGAIQGGTWLVQGSAGSIRAGDVADWQLTVDSTLASLRAGRVVDTTIDLGGDVRSLGVVNWAGGSLNVDGTIRSLSVTGNRREAIDGDLSTNITATALGSMTVRGDLDTARVVLLQSVDPDNTRATALGRATVSGAVRGSWIVSAGHMGSITLGALDAGSVIFAGVGQDTDASGRLEYAELMGLPDLDADGTPDLPDDAGDFFDALASIRSVKVRGLPGSSTYGFESSNVAAGVLRTAHLGMVDTQNTGAIFGLSTGSFSQLSFTDNQATHRIRNALDLGELSFDQDYVVRLV
ncbi:MAG: hypothetical protein OER86_08895, partial [Phycisphaerae bacterium]|nr:hypothetical protein [Phycisphaerae bacterium]